MSRRSGWYGVAVALSLVSLIAANPAMGTHIPNHNYSVGFETTNGNFTGVSVERADLSVTVPPDGCQELLGPHAMYQSQWLGDNHVLADWLELGTGHQCADSWRFHYWGYAVNGNWNFLGHVNIPGYNTHTFRITRGGDSIWDFKIDGDVKDSFYWDRMFAKVSAGLESYAQYGDARSHTYHHLQYQRLDNSTWHDWSGQDDRFVQDPPMCGYWVSGQSWLAA